MDLTDLNGHNVHVLVHWKSMIWRHWTSPKIIHLGKFSNWHFCNCLSHRRNFKKFLSLFFLFVRISGKYPAENVLQFNDLMHLLDVHQKLNVFLLMGSSHQQIIANISRYFENNPERFKRIVICSRSPRVIYQVMHSSAIFRLKIIWNGLSNFFPFFWYLFQLRKQNSQFICALWLDKVIKLGLPSILLNSPFFTFIYGLIYRNILGILTGISAVFIHKHDFNAWVWFGFWNFHFLIQLEFFNQIFRFFFFADTLVKCGVNRTFSPLFIHWIHQMKNDIFNKHFVHNI